MRLGDQTETSMRDELGSNNSFRRLAKGDQDAPFRDSVPLPCPLRVTRRPRGKMQLRSRAMEMRSESGQCAIEEIPAWPCPCMPVLLSSAGCTQQQHAALLALESSLKQVLYSECMTHLMLMQCMAHE